ncbi:uncharacterized protein SCHCODRAFT_02614036 [Schizophyllum commune H4-8]|uniref:uncharacterized protein n=1 Tax=Schizophyllum commune (strain H4-8 / FGSC 9210) TaxID=578458 RepID=UPI00215E3698|nr:uncharacterized protein SCHCODRAFT_02614036 [Schizophyllum commune H4-8]KAI5896098.1 hypothetical protein SCHCODRAFT_02614036 [Schizophyllum commune H4-8]
MNPPRGMPLLSGPPPPPSDTGRAEIACRKCNKEFNIIFTRARRCNHCGYSYCHSCSDYQALMPRETRSGTNAGYDPAPVCAFCIEMLNITATPPSSLRQMPLAKLKRYVTAYGIRAAQLAVEKEEMVRAVVGVRGQNGCLPLENERFYRRHSVPKHPDNAKPRGLFSTRAEGPPPPAQPPRETRPEFARPDLAPDGPPPPTGSRSQDSTGSRPPYQPSPGGGYQQGYAPQYQQYAPPPGAPPQAGQRPPHPPPPQSRPGGPSQRSGGGGTSERGGGGPSQRPPPPPPQTTRPPTPPPPPTLEELVDMPEDDINKLSVHNLKGILRTNHVPLGQVLEKADLVLKVKALVGEERRAREVREMQEAAERGEWEAYDNVHPTASTAPEEPRAPSPRREEAAEGSAAPADYGPPASVPPMSVADSVPPPATTSPPNPSSSPPPAPSSPNPSSSSPPKPSASAARPSPATSYAGRTSAATSSGRTSAATSYADRPGLCVVCQDEDAVLAIVDCGHLALCAPCASLIMRSTRECPLCRTRIVTEGRLLRIWRT